MLKVERQQRILERMQQSQSAVTVRELAQEFETSPITIRRDLLELGDRGLLSRTHGGAVSSSREVLAEGNARYEMYSYTERDRQQAAEKVLIAECASQFVSDGDNILINSGTTARAFAHALRGHQSLHVITNGLTVALEVARGQAAQVYVLAGRLDNQKQATIERPDAESFPDLQFREAFLGVHAISQAGIFMRDNEDAAMNRAFISSASRVTVLADQTKLDAFASFRICSWAQVHRLITDAPLDHPHIVAIQAQDVEVISTACIRQ